MYIYILINQTIQLIMRNDLDINFYEPQMKVVYDAYIDLFVTDG